jgi:aldose 1-epimerase
VYKISQNKSNNTLEIENNDKTLFGKIYLDLGASLQELTLNGNAIIQDLSPLKYDETYASSILFPFANRIKDGKYSFNNQDFQLETNQQEEQNALHGFVFDKTFSIINIEELENAATVTLAYIQENKITGFPYTYAIEVTYLFTKKSVSLVMKVKNTDSKTFPFTLGWHPYFISEDLTQSSLNFDCHQKLIIGDRNITTGIEKINSSKIFNIEDKQLDDCWILNADKVSFNTPKYQLNFESTSKENFLQAYTPPRLNTIAIEPTTGVSDSFNNKIGLQTLKPNEEYSINWKISIKNN